MKELHFFLLTAFIAFSFGAAMGIQVSSSVYRRELAQICVVLNIPPSMTVLGRRDDAGVCRPEDAP